MQQSDIMFIQEHCLFEGQLSKLKNICEDTDMTGKSSMNESIPLISCQHGGCAIIYKTNIKCEIREVKCSH